ncbi:LysR family transcriptional regulator [Streptomyces sp. SID7958]|uniref:LysR family transcriptional regulator n=2 Tax=unclassified Streptomyces TaxID=2593676 RepID=A0A6G3QT37_9ACTN|nr:MULTISPECIES: LysR family transcriptional regulator [unclassified Streptomyces]NEA86668.1 LysR family transcriptional regulator [Streptomyces sp. SID14436]NEC81057.1 LysR family transcriptional regulator [Streptomyces sp. SID7958]
MVAGETVVEPIGAITVAEPSVHQLRLFLVLSEELHFGRAAARLFITQSALSQQIRSLEKRLKVALFERSSRAVALTSAGRALLPDVRAAVEAMERLRWAANAQGRHLSGLVRVGTIGAEAAMPHTRAVLQALRREHPRLEIQLLGLNFVDQLGALYRREADVVFLRPPVPDDIELHHLATEPRVACLPSGDPLAALPRLALAQLAGYPVVDVPARIPRVWWDFWAVDPRPDGTAVRYGPVAPDLEALLHSVAQGEAMAFLPAAARDFFRRPGVGYVDVDGLAPCTSALAWLADHRDHPGVAAVRRAARSVVHRRTHP